MSITTLVRYPSGIDNNNIDRKNQRLGRDSTAYSLLSFALYSSILYKGFKKPKIEEKKQKSKRVEKKEVSYEGKLIFFKKILCEKIYSPSAQKKARLDLEDT